MARSHSRGRPLSTRRAHRPDGKVYRALRRRGFGRPGRGGARVVWTIAVLVLVSIGLAVYLMR